MSGARIFLQIHWNSYKSVDSLITTNNNNIIPKIIAITRRSCKFVKFLVRVKLIYRTNYKKLKTDDFWFHEEKV